MCGWQVKLCDPVFTHAIRECVRDEQLIINHYTNNFLVYFKTHFNSIVNDDHYSGPGKAIGSVGRHVCLSVGL